MPPKKTHVKSKGHQSDKVQSDEQLIDKNEKDALDPVSAEVEFITPEKKDGVTDYTDKDYQFLSQNEFFRYTPNGREVGHALIATDKQGKKTAFQFEIPTGEGDAPPLRRLHNIQEIARYGLTRYQAQTEMGTPMYAKRLTHLKVGDTERETEMDLAYFSPSEDASGKEKEPFWGGGNKPLAYFSDGVSLTEQKKILPLFSDKLKKSVKKELQAELDEIVKKGKVTKGHAEPRVLDAESIQQRDINKKRNPDQNTVMGESAQKAYAYFLDKMTDELSPEMKEILKRAVDAPLRDMFYSNYRPEWLHAEGFSLAPLSSNPQRQDNLGAAPKWANTEMMVLERLAKWFVLNVPESYTTIFTRFEMLLDTELVEKIHFEVTVKEKEKFVQFLQDLNPFQKYPLFRKASDLAQATAVTQSLLNDIDPVVEQEITHAGLVKLTPVARPQSAPAPFIQSKQVSTQPVAPSRFFSRAATPAGGDRDSALQSTKVKAHWKEKSVVQVLTTFKQYDYDADPWTTPTTRNCSGSGVVIEHQGRKYILTNAHVVENAELTRVRIANTDKEYFAKPLQVSYQCDLAILEVSNNSLDEDQNEEDCDEFNRLVVPVKIGSMVRPQTAEHPEGTPLQVVGFPIGGEEICVTDGNVSRIEVGEYSMSGYDMLQVQVSAPINSGNSGGPVFSVEDNTLIGIAFQGMNFAQSTGYMIPTPIITHFLHEFFHKKNYQGFPYVPVEFDRLKNPLQRAAYGLRKDQTGVLIASIDTLSDAYKKLKKKDVLLAVDGHLVSDTGTVDVNADMKRIDQLHLAHMKYIGDSITYRVLRKNELNGKFEELDVDIMLDCVPVTPLKVQAAEHDKMPTYYINSGVVFVPLTHNYLEGRGSDLEELHIRSDDFSGKILDAPKKNLDDQFVVLDQILAYKSSRGYKNAIEIVETVNGKQINNMKELIAALETNPDSYHCIKTLFNSEIFIPNLAKEEHTKLLRKYNIPQDRSNDLVPAISAPVPARDEVAELIAELDASPAPKSTGVKRARVVENNEAMAEKRVKSWLDGGMMPGEAKFAQFVRKLDERVQAGEFDEEDVDDEDYDASQARGRDEEESLGSNDSDCSGDDEKPAAIQPISSRRRSNVHRFFTAKSKVSSLGQGQRHVSFSYKDDEEEAQEMKEPSKKRRNR